LAAAGSDRHEEHRVRIDKGQVAVITGGASGIGYGLAEALAARGVRLVLSDIRADGLAAAQASLREAGAEVTAVAADVGDAASVRAIAARAMGPTGGWTWSATTPGSSARPRRCGSRRKAPSSG
jgi:NAD(P)-dependent dehydrogenase (short-subunit alcohol dehydrogenase family)